MTPENKGFGLLMLPPFKCCANIDALTCTYSREVRAKLQSHPRVVQFAWQQLVPTTKHTEHGAGQRFKLF